MGEVNKGLLKKSPKSTSYDPDVFIQGQILHVWKFWPKVEWKVDLCFEIVLLR